MRAAHVLNHWTEPRYPRSLTGSAEASPYGLHQASNSAVKVPPFTAKSHSHVVVRAGVLRFSIIPVGRLYGWQIATVAVLGPGASCLVGGLTALLIPGSTLQYWFLLHAIFLLPFFGDGRGFLFGIRRRARLVGLRAPGVNR